MNFTWGQKMLVPSWILYTDVGSLSSLIASIQIIIIV